MLGTYRNKLDAKGRLTVPASWFPGAQFPICYLGRFEENCLRLYPDSARDRFEAALLSLAEEEYDGLEARIAVYGQALQLHPDQQNRIRLDRSVIDALGADKELLIIGLNDSFLLANPTRFRQQFPADALAQTQQRFGEHLARHRKTHVFQP